LRIVLGIETSCDETAVALYSSRHGVLAHEIYSQVKLHADYGGVVPELASRDHVRKTLPLLKKLLQSANVLPDDIDGVAYTKGPGLVGALMVGAAIGRSLSFAWNVPCIGVHHMEGHLMAALLEKPAPNYPFVALLVSGGHTMLIEVTEFGRYRMLGESVDDAVGEAFDKTAKLLGLPYPGGPALAQLAEQGVPGRFNFPRPMLDRPGLDFSFSGLKTAAMLAIREANNDAQTRADIACAFEDAIVETLLRKCQRALNKTGLKRLVIVGGVSANRKLRASCHTLSEQQALEIFFPRQEFSTDNAAMIAYTGFLRLQRGERESLSFDVKSRWPMTQLV